MKISFITTVFNEEQTIDSFMKSLVSQTKLPNEIIIVDGGSRDKTLASIKYKVSSIKNERLKRIKFKILVKKGNRSVGRNEAVKHASGDIVVCSDSGNILDKDWIKNITKPFKDSSVDVVAGYYQGKAKNLFQKCLIPYALVMPDKINPDRFLPATRSIAFTKKIWEKVGKFDERFSHNEDYVFANRLKESKAKIVFAKKAIVYWMPRTTYKQTFVMFFRFALGDAESGMWRTNVLLLFARYFLGLYFIFLSLLYRSYLSLTIIGIACAVYIIWAIKKNYRYIKSKKAYIILPLLQFTADAAVLSGTLLGFLKQLLRFDYRSYTKQNVILFVIVAVYVGLLSFTLRWGTPNLNHPFPYHMDEWHQLQAVANTFRYGTPNTAGSANGTMFEFLLSGFYLIPFVFLKIINPFALSITNSVMRERVFEILRFQTIIFGVLSIFVMYRISGLINASKNLSVFFFTFTPIWLMLSGYFKYDIALMFWIVLSLYFFLRFAKQQNNKSFLYAAVPTAIAVAVKISALPLLICYILSYFLFHPLWKKSWKYLFTGILLFIGIVIFFGMPDTIFGKGNILIYLYQNLIQSQGASSNFILPIYSYFYLLFVLLPLLFGQSLFFLFVVSCFFWTYIFFRYGLNKYRIELFLWFCTLIFLGSVVSIQIFGSGNRSLVLLPFFVLAIVLTWKQIKKYNTLIKSLFLALIFLTILFQLYISFSWINIKFHKSSQEVASNWIVKKIPSKNTIGIEAIPIYQYLPNIIEKEYYFDQYSGKNVGQYQYQLVDYTSKHLPATIVITNDEIEKNHVKQSVKNKLVARLITEGYKKVATFKFMKPYSWINETDFYFTWIIPDPSSTTIFQK